MALPTARQRKSNATIDPMTYATCVPNPQSEDEFFIQIHKWMLALCDDNKCAAVLLSNFIVWQNWKIRTDAFNQRTNDIAEEHGEPRRYSEDVWMFKSLEGLSESILNLFGTKTIKEALKFLEKKGVISIHSTPNKNHHYDKRSYFRFYPEVVNAWLKNVYPSFKKPVQEKVSGAQEKLQEKEEICEEIVQKNTQAIESIDVVKVPNALGKNAGGTGKNAVTINDKHITNKKDKLINKNECRNFDQSNFQEPRVEIPGLNNHSVKAIVAALIGEGFPASKLNCDAATETIQRLQQAGADTGAFLTAHAVSCHATQGKGFGMGYLAKAVESFLKKSKAQAKKAVLGKGGRPLVSAVCYEESDLSNAQSWAGDLI